MNEREQSLLAFSRMVESHPMLPEYVKFMRATAPVDTTMPFYENEFKEIKAFGIVTGMAHTIAFLAGQGSAIIEDSILSKIRESEEQPDESSDDPINSPD